LLIPFVESYLNELRIVNEDIIINYPILDMDTDDGSDSGYNYIPEADGELLTVYAIAKEFSFAVDYLESQRYSEYLRWLGRYKAIHWSPKQNGRRD
jgi:hypothetical protein